MHVFFDYMRFLLGGSCELTIVITHNYVISNYKVGMYRIPIFNIWPETYSAVLRSGKFCQKKIMSDLPVMAGLG